MADEIPTLNGARVVLRPVTAADVAAIRAILDDPAVARWWRRAEWERVVEEDAVTYAVVVDGEPLGCIQYKEERDPDYRSATIDIFITARRHRQGLGSDAMRTLIDHLRTGRGHHRFTVDPAAANVAAIAAYEGLGFRRVGILHGYERTGGGSWRDALLMELVFAPEGA
jgi:aminoglycoside 6'-N-acetyltransferase